MAVETVTFGCRLNGAESDMMKRAALAAGRGADRDLVIVNTCAVTAEAARQACQSIRKLARERPRAEIVITGCAAQIEPGRFSGLPGVTRVLGNAEKMRPDGWRAGAPRVAVGDIMAETRAGPPAISGRAARTRATLQVQNGCDHRCTFCVIPFGRGNARSVPLAEAVAGARALVAEGAREIVLTGVDLTSWGKDFCDDERPRLGELVAALLAEVEGLERLRLSSIDSIEVDETLMELIATERRLMPHLHLSLQAGDDLVLKRMKRRHGRDDAIRFCATARRARPDIVFGADLIAGFPTESEAMFSRSLDLVEECGLTYLHVFPYSPRPGTPAARMPAVAPETVRERARRLRETGDAALARYLESEVGAKRSVLAETETTGRTEAFAPVRFAARETPGEIITAAIGGHDGKRLLAA